MKVSIILLVFSSACLALSQAGPASKSPLVETHDLKQNPLNLQTLFEIVKQIPALIDMIKKLFGTTQPIVIQANSLQDIITKLIKAIKDVLPIGGFTDTKVITDLWNKATINMEGLFNIIVNLPGGSVTSRPGPHPGPQPTKSTWDAIKDQICNFLRNIINTMKKFCTALSCKTQRAIAETEDPRTNLIYMLDNINQIRALDPDQECD